MESHGNENQRGGLMSYGMAKFVDDLTTWLDTLVTRFYILMPILISIPEFLLIALHFMGKKMKCLLFPTN